MPFDHSAVDSICDEVFRFSSPGDNGSIKTSFAALAFDHWMHNSFLDQCLDLFTISFQIAIFAAIIERLIEPKCL